MERFVSSVELVCLFFSKKMTVIKSMDVSHRTEVSIMSIHQSDGSLLMG